MSRRVTFLDLHRVTADGRPELDAAIGRILDSGRFVLGDAVRSFESAFADKLGAATAIGVGSGTDAVEIALRAVGVGPGDEVITQANTCPPTGAAIARIGAIPVLCDVDLESARMDPESLAAAVGPATRAIVPVHLYGECADMPAILDVAGGRELPVVEDCAQAHLATFDGQTAGTMGAAGCFSFYPTKNLGALGDGGMVVSRDPALTEALEDLRQYAGFGTALGRGFGTNSRLDEIQAAVLEAKLPRLGEWTQRRSAIAERYRTALAGSPIRPLERDPRAGHVHHLFVIRAPEREHVRDLLLENGVETLVHYPTPIHRLPAYSAAVRTPVSLDRSERLSGEVLSLPLYPQLTDEEVETVATALTKCAALTA